MPDTYTHYFPARTFSAGSIAARKLLTELGIDGSQPISAARKAAGLADSGVIPVGVSGNPVKRAEYAVERAARYEKPVDQVMVKINKKIKNMPKRRVRPRMDSVHFYENPDFATFRLNSHPFVSY